MKRIYLLVFVVLSIALLFPTQAFAREAFDDKVVFGGTYTLQSDETQNGSLVIFGGAATIEPDSVVNGDVVLLGGTVEVGGVVNGSVVGIGGAVRLNEGAEVKGDLFTLGAALRREEGTRVLGQVINGLDLPDSLTIPDDFDGGEVFEENQPTFTFDTSPFLEIVWFLFRLFMYAALAVVLMLILPKHVGRIADAAISQPVITAGAGLLTAVLAPFVLIAITITIILIPVTIVAILALFAAWLLGWISLGFELGKRISGIVKMEWAPAISAGLGTFILFLILGGFRQLIPCIGFIPHFLISIWGVGAVLMTRFGTHEYVTVESDDRAIEAEIGEPGQDGDREQDQIDETRIADEGGENENANMDS